MGPVSAISAQEHLQLSGNRKQRRRVNALSRPALRTSGTDILGLQINYVFAPACSPGASSLVLISGWADEVVESEPVPR